MILTTILLMWSITGILTTQHTYHIARHNEDSQSFVFVSE
ncbi:hypothetical protein KC19_6G053900 [Ceratodon purpureus]|uniref:Uncharacterized protein n=1 Tax=Ceratodon purpureus TaxID=3225 RepID=A0A8T0HDF0_CERPU|nr:hypothetical protein KC19_6G053900 [Ceratodon purpureus]